MSSQKYNSAIAWCFTLNNPEGQLDPANMQDLRYIVWQEERGASGTHHYQGYLELTKKKRLGGVRVLIPRAHFEPRKGTREQAIAYCKKQDSRILGPWEWGQGYEKGHRSDLKKAYHMIKKGATEQELMEEDFGQWARNYHAFVRAKRLLLPPRNFKTKVIVLFGVTGSGKSRWCAETFPGAYWKPRGVWWEGYEQQEVVIIDDFYGWLPWDFMLRLLDRNPFIVDTKGGSEVFNSKIIVITSNVAPFMWYDFDKNPYMILEALIRRLDIIVEYKEVNEYRAVGDRGIFRGEKKFVREVLKGSLLDIEKDNDNIIPVRNTMIVDDDRDDSNDSGSGASSSQSSAIEIVKL